MADWEVIKADYISSGSSYKQLAAKYNVHRTQVERHGKAEGWVELRRQHAGKVLSKALQKVSEDQSKRLIRIMAVSDDLLEKVERMLREYDTLDTQSLRHISGILKDIKEIQMIRSEGDLQEQQARIDKLRADAARGEKGAGEELAVSFEGDMGTYGE